MLRRRDDPTTPVPLILALHSAGPTSLGRSAITQPLDSTDGPATKRQRVWSRRPVRITAIALCAFGICVALFGGTPTPSPYPEATPQTASTRVPSPSEPVSVAPNDTADPRDVVSQMLRAGELGSDVMNWNISEPVVESRNGDIVLVRVSEASSGDPASRSSLKVLLVRHGGGWVVRDITRAESK